MTTKWKELVAVSMLSLLLGACATTTETAKDGDGAATTGADGRGGPTGTALDAQARERLSQRVVYFEFDSSAIDDDSRAVIEAHAAHLGANPKLKVRLEGHADERGTREYNLALGERRGQSVERLMRVLGLKADRITVVSYGEEKPVSPGHDESAWRLNRRVEIMY
jgi:peptidoglycan-associated lipoprotein